MINVKDTVVGLIVEKIAEVVEIKDFGRREILAIRQNLQTKVMEFEKENIFLKYKDKVGEIITAEVYQVWRKEILIVDEDGIELFGSNIPIIFDGENFTEIARQDYGLTGGIHDGNECQKFIVSFPETSARYLKIKAEVIKALPEWHSGAGRPGFLFVDEIVVK